MLDGSQAGRAQGNAVPVHATKQAVALEWRGYCVSGSAGPTRPAVALQPQKLKADACPATIFWQRLPGCQATSCMVYSHSHLRKNSGRGAAHFQQVSAAQIWMIFPAYVFWRALSAPRKPSCCKILFCWDMACFACTSCSMLEGTATPRSMPEPMHGSCSASDHQDAEKGAINP